jgi:HSP20 family molecular chaperone IbpA
VVCSLQPVLVTKGRIEYVYLCCGHFFQMPLCRLRPMMQLDSQKKWYNPVAQVVRPTQLPWNLREIVENPIRACITSYFRAKCQPLVHLPTLSSFYCSEPVNHKNLRKLAVKNVVGFEPLLAIELVEGDCDYTYHVPLPNVATATLEVKLKNGCFTIKAERSHWQAVSVQGQTYKTERVYGGVEKSIEIPADADEGSVQASFKHNILIVKFMKTQSGGRSVHLMNKPADKGIVTWREGNQDAMSHFNFNIGKPDIDRLW